MLIDLRTSPGGTIPRPGTHDEPVAAVQAIIEDVRNRGDAALFELTERLDGVRLASIRVASDQIEQAAESVEKPLLQAMKNAAGRIRRFAEHQMIQPWQERIDGGLIGEAVNPLGRAGIYVPGGRAAYPSTVLMGSVPATVAGVPEIALCVPPGRDGQVPQATLAAAYVGGLTEVYSVGGAQAIAAMALGTESIKAVDVIAGPGNQYVALAKKQLAGIVAIDSIAGPSEIAIVADAGGEPEIIALDLIAQAEHGPNGSFVVVSWDETVLTAVDEAVKKVLAEIQASEQLLASLRDGLVKVWVRDLSQAMECLNEFAPEHLQLMFEGADDYLAGFTSAGAIFSGPYSPVSLGDYVAGTNHVLPTGGAARRASGLRTSHFQKTTATVKFERDSLADLAGEIDVLARAEGLPLHFSAVEARLKGKRSEAT